MKEKKQKQPKNKTRKGLRSAKRVMVVELIKSAAAVSVGLIVIFITTRTIKDSAQTIASNKALISATQQRQEAISNAQVALQSIEGTDTVITNGFLTPEQVALFLRDLNNLADTLGVVVQTSFDEPTTSQYTVPGLTLSQVRFTIQLKASVKDLTTFLADFEQLPYFAGIGTIAMNTTSVSGWTNENQVNLSGTIYIRQEDNQTP